MTGLPFFVVGEDDASSLRQRIERERPFRRNLKTGAQCAKCDRGEVVNGEW